MNFIWDINYLLVHVGIFAGAVVLYEQAPDAIQKLTLFVIGLASVIYISADVAAISGLDPVWPIRVVASRIEHVAVGIYIFRQIWVRSQICQLLKSSNFPAS